MFSEIRSVSNWVTVTSTLFLLALCLNWVLGWVAWDSILAARLFTLLLSLQFYSSPPHFANLAFFDLGCRKHQWNVSWLTLAADGGRQPQKSLNLGPVVSVAGIAWYKFLGPKSSNSGDSGKTPKLAPAVEVTQVILTTHLCSTADLAANQCSVRHCQVQNIGKH